MNIFEAKSVVFKCPHCDGLVRPDVALDKESELGFVVPTATCVRCDWVFVNEEDTETFMGIVEA
jgi:predicted RNA-binding Zn-ribbon protein involved in translation (DUF1610 family)